MKTKILITGASGFVGGAFCQRHGTHPGLEIRGLGRRPTSLPGYIQADLTKPLEIDWKPDVVIHAAARSSPWGSYQEFHRQNVEATENVVELCKQKNVSKLIYISSSSVFYKEGDQLQIYEEDPIGPDFVNTYAQTKYEGELVAKEFPGKVVILRPRAVFGPGDTVLFPRILRAAQSQRMVKISRPGPAAVGDLIYIDTLVDYMLTAALVECSGEFNLTNNQPVEIISFLESVFEQLDLPKPTREVARDRAMKFAGLLEFVYGTFLPWMEPPITKFGVGVLGFSKTFNVQRCLDALGPPSVDLKTGIAEFVAWQKEQWAAKQAA
jgi:nucleoside-diphosphate-sugar epimerase